MKIYGKKKDAQHTQIVKELQKCGVAVLDLSDTGNGCADILTHYNAYSTLIELKEPKGEFKRKQIELMANWKGHIGFARNFDEALNVAKHPMGFGLNLNERLELRRLLATDGFERLGMTRFLETIGRK